MKTMTIREVPDELHAALKERARRHRRSLNQQVIAELSGLGMLETERERAARVENEIRRSEELRRSVGRFMTPEEIDAAIEDGRA